MVIIKAHGGLGNQMFQYALYRRMKESGKNVKMDLTSYIICKKHNGFELDKMFNINIDYASKEEILSLLLENSINEYELNGNHNFSKEILQVYNGYLAGYWQIENYFKPIRSLLLEDYKIKIYDDRNVNILEKINSSESISIHIRRGDYLSDSNLNGMATLDYYERAIEIIKDNVVNPEFFIFSDDMDWVKENLNIENSTIIDFNSGEDSYKDMFLMSKCKHNIIANSSFSWWGAWLNTNEEKIVIRPAKWMKNSKVDDDICSCDTWIKCDLLNNKHINEEYIQEKKVLPHKFYVDREIFEFLSNMFEGKEYSFIKSLKGKEHKYISYFKFRVAIIEKNNKEMKDNYDEFIKSMDGSVDFNLHISMLFHFGKYKFDTNALDEAKLIFEKINSLTEGTHKKAQEYLFNFIQI